MNRLYYVIFTCLGAGYGGLLYLVGRQAVVSVIDTTALVPDYPYVTAVVNVVGLFAVACLLVVFVTRLLRWLRIDRM